jgi:hypothetical protein
MADEYERCECGNDTFRIMIMKETYTAIRVCARCGQKEVL